MDPSAKVEDEDVAITGARDRKILRYVGIAFLAGLLLVVLRLQLSTIWSTWYSLGSLAVLELKIVTWNIAAINNNPFEYWITHENPDYNHMMDDIEQFLSKPGEADVKLEEVFRQEMVAEVVELMKTEGWEFVDEAQREFESKYLQKTIVAGFLKDKAIGSKRLVSMPDRYTNTINTANGSRACRPAVGNCYAGRFLDFKDWWSQWKHFMFEEVLEIRKGSAKRACELIQPIPREKYKDLSEDEEKMSKPLSLLSQAAFDAILVHMLAAIGDGLHKDLWQSLRREMCVALNDRKSERTLEILSGQHYANADIIFLQEVASAFVGTLGASQLGRHFHIVAATAHRDQNSLILLRNNRLGIESLKDRTQDVLTTLREVRGEKALQGVADGDIVAVTVETSWGYLLLASFHGDTNGKMTLPVLEALHKLSTTLPPDAKGRRPQLIFGLDANTYEYKDPADKVFHVIDFASNFTQMGFTSCWGDKPDPKNHTTFNARTYLQPQLNKAVSRKDLHKDGIGDKNPKDFILFPKHRYTVQRTWKDNTGEGRYEESIVFPTLSFPSDHGILATKLTRIAA